MAGFLGCTMLNLLIMSTTFYTFKVIGWREGSITKSCFSNPRILVMRSKSSMLLFINDEMSDILDRTLASEFLSMKLLSSS